LRPVKGQGIYFFKVHLIELQENKRQKLKKRAAKVSSANDEEINWDDVADLAGNSNSDLKNHNFSFFFFLLGES
jgi:protein tyrosine/serine phosphatase